MVCNSELLLGHLETMMSITIKIRNITSSRHSRVVDTFAINIHLVGTYSPSRKNASVGYQCQHWLQILIILILVCKPDIKWVHGNLSNLFLSWYYVTCLTIHLATLLGYNIWNATTMVHFCSKCEHHIHLYQPNICTSVICKSKQSYQISNKANIAVIKRLQMW